MRSAAARPPTRSWPSCPARPWRPSTATASAAVPSWPWPAATAWPPMTAAPASACRKPSWASSRAGAAARACRSWWAPRRRWT
ncbi:hypothetical protein G6F68_019184 [Rhizopus microsporus]|nr:hypothetical protein G6F68_019184 [Rhizopus microsporus]